jgi:CheY-like chemotaxis protein
MPQPRILYCDDEPALRDIVAEQLAESGFAVDTAADGIEGIERLEKDPGYDVLLLDINMPGKSGLDVLKYVKEKGLKCRTIMLTGQVGFSKGVESMKLGAQGYITKDALELQPDGQIEKSDLNIDFLLMTIKRVLPGA